MYTDRSAREYRLIRYRGLDQRLVDRSERRILSRWVRKVLGPGKIALDVPSGYGRFTPVLHSTGARIVRSDRSLAMLHLGSKDGSSVLADVRALPFRDRSFDLVLCVRLLQHLPGESALKALDEVARVSRGHVALTFYAPSALHRLQRTLAGRGKMNWMTAKDVQNALRRSGFATRCTRRLFPGLHAQSLGLFERTSQKTLQRL
jgi:ubiquinone/menaquinone biosynthesis C-methylase UbiE